MRHKTPMIWLALLVAFAFSCQADIGDNASVNDMARDMDASTADMSTTDSATADLATATDAAPADAADDRDADEGGIDAADTGTNPTGGDLLFAVDWETSLGNSTEALTDGDKLAERGFPSSLLLEVVSLADLGLDGWPANALELSFDDARSASLVGIEDGWPAPDVGARICYRFLLYNGLPEDSGVAFDHGMQSNIGSINHGWQLFSPMSSEGGDFPFGFFSLSGGVGTDTAYFAYLPAQTPLRIEWCFIREAGPATAKVEIAIFDETVSTTVPQWDASDFHGNYGEGPDSIGSLDPSMDFSDESVGFRSYLFGVSGSSSTTASGALVTGFAVCADDFCGPYSAAEAD